MPTKVARYLIWNCLRQLRITVVMRVDCSRAETARPGRHRRRRCALKRAKTNNGYKIDVYSLASTEEAKQSHILVTTAHVSSWHEQLCSDRLAGGQETCTYSIGGIGPTRERTS